MLLWHTVLIQILSFPYVIMQQLLNTSVLSIYSTNDKIIKIIHVKFTAHMIAKQTLAIIIITSWVNLFLYIKALNYLSW